MKNIFVILNPQRPDPGTIDFACYMAKISDSKLTGVFIENVFFNVIPDYHPKETPYFSSTPGKESEKTLVKMDADQAINVSGKNAKERRSCPIFIIVRENRYRK